MALKATNDDQRLLLTLQEADTRIVRLQGKAKSLPQTKRIEELGQSVGLHGRGGPVRHGGAEVTEP